MLFTGQRKVLLLIPSLDTYQNDRGKIDKLLQLRNDCNLIVQQVSNAISRQLAKNAKENLNDFEKRFGLPNIALDIADCTSADNYSGIRLCLTQLGDMDFSKNFKLNKADLKTNDITHLIEVIIDEQQDKPMWCASKRKDNNDQTPFDVTVKTNVKSLFNVVLSFMIDMYAYYIVGLSSEFEFRFNFNTHKIQFFKKRFGAEIKNAYNLPDSSEKLSDKIHYLPLSFRYYPTENDLKLADTINDYYTIIFKYIIKKNTFNNSSQEKSFQYISEKNMDVVTNALKDYLSILAKRHNKSYDTGYFAVYLPLFDKLGIKNNLNRQRRLAEDIENQLAQNGITTYKFDESGCFYFFVPECNIYPKRDDDKSKKLRQDIFPLFSYFEWITISF